MATKKPKGLGRGLENLLGPTVSESPAPAADGLPHELDLSELVAKTLAVAMPRKAKIWNTELKTAVLGPSAASCTVDCRPTQAESMSVCSGSLSTMPRAARRS